jgi:protein involved in polysaccharide export with SLBB domain
MKRILTFALVFILSISGAFLSQAQDISQTDLSQVKVDDLSDAQIESLIKKAESQNLSESQLEQLALQRGMSSVEVAKLKTRIEKIKSSGTKKTDSEKFSDRSREQKTYDTNSNKDPLQNNSEVVENNSKDEGDFFNGLTKNKKQRPEDKIFGFSLFNKDKLSFEPSLNIATPINYKLGPGDQVFIDIWGASQENYQKTISPDGTLFIDNIGVINLNGFTIEEATQKLKKSLSRIYSGLNSGNTSLKVSLGNIRSIKVNIVGDVYKPGTYTIPSLSSAFNALYAAGGPSINGTLREIKVIRNGKTVNKLDFYNFLVNGEQKDNIRLEDQDVIFISAYTNRVEVKGEVKRPLYYDVLNTETLKDVIRFSGGFTSKAYNQRLKIIRNTGKEQKIFDIDFKDADTLFLTNGDQILVDSVLNKFENRVEIKGAVYRPGYFSIDGKLTLKELIQKADGIRGDAFKNRISIYRTKEDYTVEVVSVDLNKLLSNSADIDLIKDDLVVIPSIFDLKEEYFIKISGDIKKPGDYLYTTNSTIEDVILQAGGLLESASLAKVEVARRIKNSSAINSTDEIAQVFQFAISEDLKLSDGAKKFTLEPYDNIFIRRSPGYEEQQIITLDGEFLFPGRYAVIHKNDRISDLITRSGGLTPEAFPRGAKLQRIVSNKYTEHRAILDTLKFKNKIDSIDFRMQFDSIVTVGINLEKIIAHPKSKFDILLQNGDKIIVPKEMQTVHLLGEVLAPVLVRYEKGKSFKSYISKGGGFTSEALKRKSYVVYPNGMIDRTRKILIFNSYPKVEPGSELIVPKKPVRKGISTGEIITLSGTLMSAMAIVVAAVIAAKN